MRIAMFFVGIGLPLTLAVGWARQGPIPDGESQPTASARAAEAGELAIAWALSGSV